MKESPVWSAKGKAKPSDLVVAYCAGRDVVPRPPADSLLVPCDVQTNKAHLVMLAQTGIIPAKEAGILAGALLELEQVINQGDFDLLPEHEDVHINIEAWLAKNTSAVAAGYLHTARSRNDQVACDMRLFLRDRILQLEEHTLGLITTLCTRAHDLVDLPIPGFTHHRHGAVSTVAHLYSAHAQALARDLERLQSAYQRVNRSPLGAVAGYGTSWPIDRELSARLLGFDTVEPNTLDAISTRWEMEAEIGSCCSILMNHLSTMSQDMILFSTGEYNLVHLPEELTTGSSVMPQKRNPDFAEVTKARAAVVAGHLGSLLSLSRGNLSGYNRDTQWSKYLIMDLLDEVGKAPQVAALVWESAQWNRKELQCSVGRGFLYAVDLADGLARDFSIPFRLAYRAIGAAVAHAREDDREDIHIDDLKSGLEAESLECKPDKEWLTRHRNAESNLMRRSHLGGPAPQSEQVMLKTLEQSCRDFSCNQETRKIHLERSTEYLSRELRKLIGS
jgi:argininosuccinate lyase